MKKKIRSLRRWTQIGSDERREFPVSVRRLSRHGFTLLELLASMTILSVILLLLFQITKSSTSICAASAGKIQTLQAARSGFESLSRNLSQADLLPYYSYADSEGNPVLLLNPAYRIGTDSSQTRDRVASQYLRASELHFVCGPGAALLEAAGSGSLTVSGDAVFFQAPLGFVRTSSTGGQAFESNRQALTVCGYYIQFTPDTEIRPSFFAQLAAPPKSNWRYRLVEVLQPAQYNSIYDSTNEVDSSGLPVSHYDLNWIKNLALDGTANRHILANNVIFLALLPKLSPAAETAISPSLGDGSYLAPHYAYDSRSWESGYTGGAEIKPFTRNQLPPIMEAVMVAIDEQSAQRLADQYGGADGSSPPLADPRLAGALGLSAGFTDAKKLDDDLKTLKDGLNAQKINYRILRTDIRLQSSRWSNE